MLSSIGGRGAGAQVQLRGWVFNLPHRQQTYILHTVFSGLSIYILTPLKLTSSKIGHIGQFTSIFGASHTLMLTLNCNISFIFIHT